MNIMAAFELWARATSATGALGPSTIDRYRRGIRAWARHGLVTLEDLSAASMLRAQDGLLEEGATAATVNVELVALKKVVAFASKRAILTEPAADALLAALKKLRLKLPPSKPPTYYTRHDYEQLRELALTIRPWLRLAVDIATFTGIRRGELRRLEWEDLDLGLCPVLRVRRKTDMGAAGETKSRKERTISLCDELVAILRLYQKPSGPVFPTLDPSTAKTRFMGALCFQEAMLRLQRESGIAGSWHKFRRTFTTWGLKSGIVPTDMADMLGHANLDMLYKHYYCWIHTYNPQINRLSLAG